MVQINHDAFNGINDITSVTIPASVTTVGSAAFLSTSLTSVTFEESDQPLELYKAFGHVDSAPTITINRSIQTNDEENVIWKFSCQRLKKEIPLQI